MRKRSGSKNTNPDQARRAELRAKIAELCDDAIYGSPAVSYRTCGNPDCRCHHGGPKHGPHMYVNYRRDGKTRGYYVPAKAQSKIRAGIAAWHQLQAALTEIADLNRDQTLAVARTTPVSTSVSSERPRKKTQRSTLPGFLGS